MNVIDTSDNVSAHLGNLKNRDVGAVGRYYSLSAWKRITRQEAIEISKVGMQIFVVFEDDGDPELTSDNGIHHAQIAAKQARDIGQPEGSAIYFALEHLPGGYKKQHLDAIKEYIGGAKEGLAGRFKIGAYSDGVVCDALLSSGMCDYAWLSASLSFEGSREFLASNRWSLAQDPHVGQNWDGLSVDVNQAKPDFCAFQVAAEAAHISTTAAFAESGGPSANDEDPAFPAEGEISDTADFDTARLLANLGAPSAPDVLPPGAPTFAAGAALGVDLARAKAFLEACRTSTPRVTYGLGKKVPFLGAVPGRDFTQVDCSGFVREAIRLSTTPRPPFPDGSVNQHDWVHGHGFKKTTIAAGMANDDVVRIAFLRPQDSPNHIGHVALISGGMTLESHGGVGPDSRAWDGRSWQAKTFVYVLARDAQVGLVQGGATLQAAQPLAATVTVRHGHRYRAAVSSLRGEAQWAICRRTSSVRNHHDELLVVKMRPDAMTTGPAMGLSAMAAAPTTAGLSALAFYERAGMVKRVVPLRKHDERAAPGPRLSAASALMFSPEPMQEAEASTGISFIELERGQDIQQLHTALASDPNVLSVSKVPVRYLAARPASRKAPPQGSGIGIEATPPQGSGIGIEATPPDASILWNLKKILWEEARDQADFHEADEVQVAVLDTGVDDQHPDLRVDAYHWQQPDLSRPVSNKDIIGHGTHVSGTIAALINGSVAVKGICKCRLSVWKIFDDEPTYAPGVGAFVYYVNPIMYRRALASCVENPVDVINLSIGGPGAPEAVERSLFDQLIAAGVTICAAMGNERQYGSPTSYPGAIPGVIAVGATGLDDRVTLFSNSGNHIAVAAPGKAIWSTLPTYAGQTGFGAVIGPDGTSRQGKPMRREMNYDAWDGTSMATPHVTGCAALLIAKSNAAGNKRTPEQVRQSLMTSADKVSAMNGTDFSTDYGAGRVNLLKLLQ